MWSAAGESIDLTGGVLVGVLNVTPDSFSDGGEFMDPSRAIDHGLKMVEDGAAMVDVGGESTRPGAAAVTAEVELRRVLPVISALTERGVRVSVDTSKPEVAREALKAGAAVVNDVTGFRHQAMVDVLADSDSGAVVMHMQGEPRTMQDDPTYGDVVADVGAFLIERRDALAKSGVAPKRIVLDPGFGFGKTAAHNLDLLRGLGQLAGIGHPVMIGTSRKSTLRAITGETGNSDVATAVTTALGYERGARLFRVHDVASSRDALKIAAAIVG